MTSISRLDGTARIARPAPQTPDFDLQSKFASTGDERKNPPQKDLGNFYGTENKTAPGTTLGVNYQMLAAQLQPVIDMPGKVLTDVAKPDASEIERNPPNGINSNNAISIQQNANQNIGKTAPGTVPKRDLATLISELQPIINMPGRQFKD